jgi:hypothetical protein
MVLAYLVAASVGRHQRRRLGTSLDQQGLLRFLDGGGEMGERIRVSRWDVPLGPPVAWPQALKTLVNLVPIDPSQSGV